MELETIVYIFALIALLIGIVLALFGRSIWGMLLAGIGGMIGWMLGFAVGVLLFGFGNLMSIILVFICGFVGSFVMGAIFRFLVEAALALLAAILAAGVFWYMYPGQVLVALIIFAIVFVISYVFIEKVVVVVTAFIGSIIAGIGIYFLLDNAGYAVIGALVFTVLALPHFFVVTNPETQRSTSLTMTIISGAGAALITYLNSQNKGMGGTLQSFISKIPSGLLNGLLGLFVIIFNLSLIFIVEAVINSLPGLIIWTPWVIFGVSIILFGVVMRFININHISPHYFFRDQVGEVFLKTEISNNKGKIILARDQSKVRLTDINPMGCSAPYHIVVGAINLPGSYNLRFKDRKSQHFIFTRDYNGSEVTGYALHKNQNQPIKRGYRMGATKYARTIAISGAAASSAIGYVTSFA